MQVALRELPSELAKVGAKAARGRTVLKHVFLADMCHFESLQLIWILRFWGPAIYIYIIYIYIYSSRYAYIDRPGARARQIFGTFD